MHDIQILNEKLLTAVCRGKTGSVEKLLSQGANINCRDKKDGMTPLLKACQRRNYTMQKILLSNGASTKHKDKLGLSCLHYIAEAGDTESLKMLLAYQASIDAKDALESTPLHYAADRNKLNVVDTLVFCGANAFQKNKKGIAAVKSTTDPEIARILKESELVLLGIKNGDIHIECIELEPGKTYKLEKADITIHTPANFPLKSLSFICRRVRPEYCHPTLKPYRKELLISDTFEFLTSETQTKAKIKMEVPLYDFPDPFEDIFMKTDVNPSIDANQKQHNVRRDKDEKTQGKLKWICTTDIDVTHVRSFNLVAFPTKEIFHVGRSHAELSSVVDKFIKITIQENTFSHPDGKVGLEVIPAPVYKPENLDSVLSVGHFYDLTHDRSENPLKTVNLRVPLPHDYENDGDIYLLGSNVDSDYFLDPDFGEKEDLDHWEIIDKNPKVSKLGCVNIPVEHFSIYVASEAKKNKSRDSVICETSALCRRASMRKYFVVFLVLIKPITDDIFRVLIECTTKRKVDDRMNYWMNKNYLDQKPSHIGEFESVPGSKYMLRLSGNVQAVTGFPKARLEFHPKRENCQQFQVSLSDPTASNIGSIDIYEVKDTAEGKEAEEGLVSVPFRLTGTPFVDDSFDDDGSFKGFTKDSLLRQLCNSMGEEWIKVAVLLGLSYRTVEIYRTNTKLSEQDKKFKVMQLWRDTSKHREDYGVNDLVLTLHRINREDLAQLIHEELEIWLKNNSENKDRFYKWAENKLTGPSLQPADKEQVTPASELFFVELIEKFGNYESFNEVGLQMGLSRPENDKIFNDLLTINKEHQLLGMLVAVREKIGDMFNTYTKLEKTLFILNMRDAYQWVQQKAEDWIASTEKEKNPPSWRQELVQYMKKEESTDNLLDGEDAAEEEKGTSQKPESLDSEHDASSKKKENDRNYQTESSEKMEPSVVKSKVALEKEENIGSSTSVRSISNKNAKETTVLTQEQKREMESSEREGAKGSHTSLSPISSSTPKPKEETGSKVSILSSSKPKEFKGSNTSLASISASTTKPKEEKGSKVSLSSESKPKENQGSKTSLASITKQKDDNGSTASLSSASKKSDEGETFLSKPKHKENTGSTVYLSSVAKPKKSEGSTTSLGSFSKQENAKGSTICLASKKGDEDETSLSKPKPQENTGSTVSISSVSKPKKSKGSTTSLASSSKQEDAKGSTASLASVSKQKDAKGSTASLASISKQKDAKGSTASLASISKQKDAKGSTASLASISKQKDAKGSTGSLASISNHKDREELTSTMPKDSNGSTASLTSNSKEKKGSKTSLMSASKQIDIKDSTSSLLSASKSKDDNGSTVSLSKTSKQKKNNGSSASLGSASVEKKDGQGSNGSLKTNKEDMQNKQNTEVSGPVTDIDRRLKVEKVDADKKLHNGNRSGGKQDSSSEQGVDVKSENPIVESAISGQEKTDNLSNESNHPEKDYAENLSHKIVDDALDTIHHEKSDTKRNSTDENEQEKLDELRENLETLLSPKSSMKTSKRSMTKDSQDDDSDHSMTEENKPKNILLEKPLPEANSDSSSLSD